MIKALIFDLDGTLIDSEEIRTSTELEALAKQDVHLERKEIDAYTGIPLKEWFPMLKDDHDLDMDPDQALEDATRLYLARVDEVTLQENTRKTLESAQDRYKLAVGTSSQRLVAEQILTSKELDQYFDTLVTFDDVRDGKPAPDIFNEAAHQLDIHPTKCIVVEDSPHGVEAANTGGFISIGFQDNADQDLSAADHVVGSMNELKETIETIDNS